MGIELKGSLVALITPFDDQKKVNFEGIKKLVDMHLKAGTHGLVPCGTTGESATIDHVTHKQIIKFIVEFVKEQAPKYGRTPGKDIIVVAGTGSNATQEAIELTVAAEKAGADASLQVSPYYNRPTQEGLKMHFRMIAEATKLPLVLYNIPSRTGQNIEADTIIELSKIDTIVGTKEASGNFGQIMKIIQKTRDNGFAVLSGDDQLTLPMMSFGAKGVISVAANIIPGKMVQFTEALLKGDFKAGMQMHYELLDLFNIQFIETNPGPIKYMASLLGLPSGGLLPPMTLPSLENQEKIRAVMKKAGLI